MEAVGLAGVESTDGHVAQPSLLLPIVVVLLRKQRITARTIPIEGGRGESVIVQSLAVVCQGASEKEEAVIEVRVGEARGNNMVLHKPSNPSGQVITQVVAIFLPEGQTQRVRHGTKHQKGSE